MTGQRSLSGTPSETRRRNRNAVLVPGSLLTHRPRLQAVADELPEGTTLLVVRPSHARLINALASRAAHATGQSGSDDDRQELEHALNIGSMQLNDTV